MYYKKWRDIFEFDLRADGVARRPNSLTGYRYITSCNDIASIRNNMEVSSAKFQRVDNSFAESNVCPSFVYYLSLPLAEDKTGQNATSQTLARRRNDAI